MNVDEENESSLSEYPSESFLYSSIVSNIEKASAILYIHIDVACLLLHYCKYDFDTLLEDFADNRDSLLKCINVKEENINYPQGLQKMDKKGKYECPICCEEKSSTSMFALPCNHFFCKQCWKDHTKNQIESLSMIVKCMEPECNSHIPFTNIASLCGKKLASLYYSRIVNSPISFRGIIKKCHNPKCSLSIGIKSLGLCYTVKCKCGERTCWLCGKQAHAPLKCEFVDEWYLKAGKESSEYKVARITKPCPNCQVRIQKNEGCNHMTCVSCKYEFCWLCGTEWSKHQGDPYNCNISTYALPNEQIAIPEKSLANFIKQDLLEDCEKEHMPKQKTTLKRALKKKSIDKKTENDLLKEIFEQRSEARSILKWSYPQLERFELPHKKSIFQFHISGLETSIDQLCSIIDAPSLFTVTNIRNALKALQCSMRGLLLQIDSYQ